MAETRMLLPSRDCEARVRFYVDGLGLTVERSWDDPGNRGWLLRAGVEAFVELLDATDSYPVGVPVGVQLVHEVADVDDAVARAVDHGGVVVAAPADQPWGSRNAQIRDPEGLVVNLYAAIGGPQ